MRRLVSASVVNLRVLALSGLMLLAGCSDSIGPGGTRGGWEYRALDAGLAGPVFVTFAPDLVAVSGFPPTTYVVLNPETGRERYRISWPEGGSLYRAGSVVVLNRNTAIDQYTNRIHDVGDGRLLFAQNNEPFLRTFIGTTGSVVVTTVGDSILAGLDRNTGREIWRRSIPALPCTRICRAIARLDAVGGELLLSNRSDIAAALLRVTADGTITSVPIAPDVFIPSEIRPVATRASTTSPLVIASSRTLTSVDVVSGATRWTVPFKSLTPDGYLARAALATFTRDGRWLTVRMLDSVGGSAQVPREFVLNTTDGARVRERQTDNEELLTGACGDHGMVRVLNDLRLEFTDVATGRISTSAVITQLAELRSVPTVNGPTRPQSIVVGRQIIMFGGIGGTLQAVGCEP